MTEGTKAPEVVALDQDGKEQKLSNYRGKWVVLYFYPKDDTPGCTKEACNFRDSFHTLQNMGVSILGVSKDTVESHKKFANKYQLNFPLLADIDKKITQDYEVNRRITYLIDAGGVIKKIYKSVNPLTHSGQIIRDLEYWKTE